MTSAIGKALLTAVAASLATAMYAQQPAAQDSGATIKVTSRIVVLDVVVTDKAGNVVNNLTKDDFTVTEDKNPQQILTMELPAQHVVPADITVNSIADLQRLAPQAPVSIIVLDELNTRFEDMAYARSALKKYLATQPARLPQPTLLVAASFNKFTMLHDFTQDRNALFPAIDKHLTDFPWRLVYGGSDQTSTERFAITLSTLEQVAEATKGHAGRKNIIWVGRGFMGINTIKAPPKAAAKIKSAVQDTLTMLHDARVTLYTIDPTAVNSSTVEVLDPETLETSLEQKGIDGDPLTSDVTFGSLAPITGGRATFARNDVDQQIGASIRDADNFYTLSYSPSNKSDVEQPYRRIRVTINRPGLTASTQNGYYIQPETKQASTRNQLGFDLGSAAETTMTYIGLPMTVTRSAATPDTFVIHLDPRTLSWRELPNGDRKGEVAILSESFGAKNKVLGHRVVVDMVVLVKAADLANPGSRPVDLTTKVAVPPGAARLRFVARDAISGQIGTSDLHLE